MEKESHFRYEKLEGPLAEKYMKANTHLHFSGFLKVYPSGCTVSANYPYHAERIRHLTVRPDDVWIITYPKCGTTWTQEMVWLLMNNLDYETAKNVDQTERSPFLEFGTFHKPGSEDKRGNSVDIVDDMKSPRCIKSHLPLDLLPEQLWTVKPKIIYVAREPKDVAASFYHHHRRSFCYTGTSEDFVEAFIAGIVGAGDQWDHTLRFWEKRKEPNVLFNTFEEMKKDLPGVVQRTAKFLNCTLNSEQLDKLCEHLSFESMKNNPAVSHETEQSKEHAENNAKVIGKIEPFIRKGEVGGWKSDIAPEVASKIDKWTEEKLKNTDYTIPS